MAERDDNFLSRWSRRKVAVKQGVVAPTSVRPEVSKGPQEASRPQPERDHAVRAELVAAQCEPLPSPSFDASGQSEQPPQGERGAPPPTLDDVAQLTKESDYSRFVAPDVDPGVKNAAMKKLFASDPHFNVMDGLDTYIDDYNKFEPLTKSMLRQLVSARARPDR